MRTVAEGNLKKALWFVAAVVIALLVLTWLKPFLQAYEIKTAGRLMCTDMIRVQGEARMAEQLGKPPAFDNKNVRDIFIGRARQAAIQFEAGDLDPDCGSFSDKDQPHCFSHQYSFDAQAGQHVCTIHVRYRTDTAPAIVGDVLQELPHLKLQQHIKMVQRVNKSY
ncbi:MAG: hypothetical protein A2138_14960 [Deltaproteobacteria bacterium RBG_16_71_12]|nr:MAG: hypothetical protein A2138_14960 [Deltaproteobacteria bacterium RBG_16_71_12]